MDSFTQITLGIATAEVIAGKELKNRTFLYGAILGTIPDLDILVGKFMNDVDGVAIHRGLSHSILFFACISPFFAWLIYKMEKGKIQYNKAIWLVFWCLLTHVLLDMFTSWGTQILWPLDYRFALKTIFVVDPLFTIPLLIALIFVWRNKDNFQRQKYLFRGLYISLTYLLLTGCIKLYAVAKFEQALKDNKLIYQHLIVKPTAFNCILWNANVATSEGYYLADYSLFDSQAIRFKFYSKNKTLEEKLTTISDFQKLKSISEGWYLITQQNEKLYFNDLRFGLLNDDEKKPQFAFCYEFIPSSNGNLSAVEVPKTRRDGKALMEKIFTRIKGN
ncbi:MAG TPA: metal-dependent hydrolase [Chitinophagales bacterium]|nr:metal-dependent hydrolase [Chitinophagales bacterium]HMU97354.1 metal-dependent hydrolase [Chitinophagales bacterium]HMV01796.1 metal-dependent hydrolase [Chitinophagales bacterium]HMW93827.1 metal-dependent hydrolase [Chitinophagales bacterium]HMY41424.1 metal-dependent hydrolase [Chitinophagales bacterium]